jgi:hypothetical protein
MFLFVTETACTFIRTWNPKLTYPIPEFKVIWFVSLGYWGPLDENNNFSRPILFGATCADGADITGFDNIRQVTEEEWTRARDEEFKRRQPYPSWIFDPNTSFWNPPVPYPGGIPQPDDDLTKLKSYSWNEETLSWVIKDNT